MSKVHLISKHIPWTDQAVISASGVALDGSAGELKAAQLANENPFYEAEAMNQVELRIKCLTGDGGTGTLHVYGGRKDDDICHVGDLVVTAGTQLCTAPVSATYVDTMVATMKWITETKIVDASGNNGMSRIMFDAHGYDFFFGRMEFSDGSSWILSWSGV